MIAQSCFLFKEKPSKPEPDKPDREDTTEVHVDTIILPDTTLPWYPTKKDHYKVAILLPFDLDDKFILDYDLESTRGQYRSLIATELYEGYKLAMQEFDSLGVNFTVNVFDTKGSKNNIDRLLKKKEVRQADLVFGPLFPDHLREVTKAFGKDSLNLISPLAGSFDLDTPFNNYFQVTPTMDAHMEQIAEYTLNRYPNKSILLVHSSDSSEIKWAKDWEAKYEELDPMFSELFPVKRLELTTAGKIPSTDLRLHDSTLIVFCSYNEILFNNVVRELYKVREEKPTLLFTLPDLLERLNTVRYDYLNELNLHLTNAHALDTATVAYDTIHNRYLRSYGFPPPENVWIGYNQFLYFSYLLHEVGPGFPSLMGIGNLAPVTETFDFRPVYIETADPFNERVIHHYENRFVQLYRYKDYNLTPVQHRP